MKVIYVVTTGGTIEKAYSEQSGTVANLNSKIDRYLRLLAASRFRRAHRSTDEY